MNWIKRIWQKRQCRQSAFSGYLPLMGGGTFAGLVITCDMLRQGERNSR